MIVAALAAGLLGALTMILPACEPQICPDLIPLKICTNGDSPLPQTCRGARGVGPREFQERT
jgi:hypothetical protein